MSFRLGSKKFLDRAICYELWAKRRISIYKIPAILAEEYGITNTALGRKVTAQGVWRAACLHILDHPDQAKSDTVSLFQQHGKVLDEDEWGKEIIGKAQQFLSRGTYKKFLKDHPEYQKYASK